MVQSAPSLKEGPGEKDTEEAAIVRALHRASATLNGDQKEDTSHSLATSVIKNRSGNVKKSNAYF